jgi:hypothetical protein
MPKKNNKRLRNKEPELLPEPEPETDIIIWPTDEEVYNDIKDELEPEQCICIDDEITNINTSLTEIRKDIYQLLESIIEIKRIVSYNPK